MKNLLFSTFIYLIFFNCASVKNSITLSSQDKIDSTNIIHYNSPIIDCHCKISKIDSINNISVFHSSFRGQNIKILTAKNFKLKKVLRVGNTYDLKIKSLTDLGSVSHGLRGITFENIFFEINENDTKYILYELESYQV